MNWHAIFSPLYLLLLALCGYTVWIGRKFHVRDWRGQAIRAELAQRER